MPIFPVIPDVPGVPPILRSALSAVPLPTQLFADEFSGFGAGLPPAWGIYSGAEPVVLADTVADFGFKREWAIADYPVERGGFESYDKVDIPYDARVRFAAGNSEDNRRALLDSIEAIAGTLDLYDVVTPEHVYTSVNVVHFDYRRTARNGVGLLQVDVWLLEVRVSGVSDQANAKAPSGASTVLQGTVQPVAPGADLTATLPTGEAAGP